MAGPASLFSSSSFSYGWTYDVFISFRGQDTRHGFTGHLYKALTEKGIHTFIDDKELQGGDEITPALVEAIQESRIAIVVLSDNYASSSFCLDELSEICDYIKAHGRLVLPVFYKVDPSHVRRHTGSYGTALAKHEERFKDNKDNMKRLEKWKMALEKVANLSGLHFNGNDYEHQFIGTIVKLVSSKIDRPPLYVADCPVGLESLVQQVNLLLEVDSGEGVQMVGIYGLGGIGKTTLAKAVYNTIADQFEGVCFLENVRERSSPKKGLAHLQEELLHEIVGAKDVKLGSVCKGISIIKHRLHRKKVLLILDDVDDQKQLQALVGGPDWFGFGSRVIITTRDKHLLVRHGVERTYEVNLLNAIEAFKLLNWKAFRTDKVDPSYMDVLKCVVKYASGLPLALEVIGSHLFGKRVEEWKSALNQYKRIPNKEIQEILKVSFNALEECVQDFFLDITCFFKGCQLAEVEDILFAHHGVNPKYGIGVLVDRSLVKIEHDYVTVHDLLQDMGREIVRQESPKNPGKRSRLWSHEDIIQVLKENQGTSQIQIIILNVPYFEEQAIDWNGEAFKNMKNLKTLIIRNVQFSKGPESLPSSLRVLIWWKYPSQDLPLDFYPEKITIFNLNNSYITSLRWLEKKKRFMNLTDLKLDGCECLTQIPDLSSVPELKQLSFAFCKSLITIHKSIGFLDKLIILNAKGCNRLRSFPAIKLTSLEKLCLSFCPRLERFPEIIGKMENIVNLYLEDTPIKELPYSFGNLTHLEQLYLLGCGTLHLPSSIVNMQRLWYVMIIGSNGSVKGIEKMRSMVPLNEILLPRHKNISDEFFPKVLTCFANVRELDLRCQNFTFLPACIIECRSLLILTLVWCHFLGEIRWIPPKLEKLNIQECISLKYLDLTYPFDSHCFLRSLHVHNCENLQEIKWISPKLEILNVEGCTSLKYLDLTHLADSPYILKKLIVGGCKNLQEIKWIPPKLEILYARGCISLKYLDLTHLADSPCFMKKLLVNNCENLQEIRWIPPKLEILNAEGCTSLKYLDLTHLADSPCFLKELIVDGCKNLQEIRWIPSKLEILHSRGCISLKYLDFTHLADSPCILKELVVNGCENLQEIRRIPPKLEILNAKGCTSLKYLDLTHISHSPCFKKLVVDDFKNLREIKCIPSKLETLYARGCISLKYLDFTHLADSPCFLKKLVVNGCENLQEIRWIPPKLEILNAEGCTSLKYLDLTHLADSPCFLKELVVDGCTNIQEIKWIPPSMKVLSAKNCTSLTNSCRSILLNQEFHEEANCRWCFPGSKIPEWFEHRGPSISFWFRDVFPVISLCAVVPGLRTDDLNKFLIQPLVNINGNTVVNIFEHDFAEVDNLEADHLIIFNARQTKFTDYMDQDVLLKNEWNHVEVFVYIANYIWEVPISFPNTGFHVIKQKSCLDNIRFLDPYETDDDKVSNSMISTRISSTDNVQGSKLDLELCLPVLDHQEKAAGESFQAQQSSPNVQNIQPQSPTLSGNGVSGEELELNQCCTNESFGNQAEKGQDDVEMEALYASLDAETGPPICSLSHDKLTTTASKLLRAKELEDNLEDDEKEFREVDDASKKGLAQQLADMEERKKVLEQQINAIKADISSQSEKKI